MLRRHPKGHLLWHLCRLIPPNQTPPFMRTQKEHQFLPPLDTRTRHLCQCVRKIIHPLTYFLRAPRILAPHLVPIHQGSKVRTSGLFSFGYYIDTLPCSALMNLSLNLWTCWLRTPCLSWHYCSYSSYLCLRLNRSAGVLILYLYFRLNAHTRVYTSWFIFFLSGSLASYAYEGSFQPRLRQIKFYSKVSIPHCQMSTFMEMWIKNVSWLIPIEITA